jgi:hypothetical protein
VRHFAVSCTFLLFTTIFLPFEPFAAVPLLGSSLLVSFQTFCHKFSFGLFAASVLLPFLPQVVFWVLCLCVLALRAAVSFFWPVNH